MEAVHVLFRHNGGQRGSLVQVRGQGQLHQNAVDGRIGVQGAYLTLQRLLGGILRHADGHGMHARLFAADALVAHINLAGRVVPHQNHRQARGHTPLLQRRYLPGDVCPKLLRHGLAVQQLCRHAHSSLTMLVHQVLPSLHASSAPSGTRKPMASYMPLSQGAQPTVRLLTLLSSRAKRTRRRAIPLWRNSGRI